MGTIYLPVGTPLWRDAGSPVVRVPGSAGAVDPVFAGVTVRDGEALAGPVAATSLGRGGVILARVQGPVAMNVVVGRLAATGATTVADRLVAGGAPAVGVVLRAIPTAVVALVPVRVGAPLMVQTYKLVTPLPNAIYPATTPATYDGADYLTCHTWDGTTEGSTPIYIAKHHKIRHSIGLESIEGTLYAYTYSDNAVSPFNKTRIATNGIGGSVVESCRVTPEWLLGDLIFALPCQTAVFYTDLVTHAQVECGLLMTCDPRAWAAI